MSQCDPSRNLALMACLAVAVAFCGATQDVALDAFRIESGDESRQAAFAAAYQMGYRIAMIWSGAGALAIAGAVQMQAPTDGWLPIL